ncbi:MAG: lipid IV(A) 3-deoxy-D-manno-octulosonic acid transferase [Candidatus Thiothrix moscowensis]|nr:lipid IV(A) 3-deoxy-D-manno-octulosonic acid transferase [Candidatus Thiothrix moscowensis]
MPYSPPLIRWMLRFIYNLALCVLLPFALFKLHKTGGQVLTERWRERLGWGEPLQLVRVVWLHAASVGEVMLAKPLIQELKSRYPDMTILLTTTTVTGAEQAASLGKLVTHRFAPFDCPSMVRRFLERTRPQALLVIETERWLNYMLACQANHIPVVVVNGRLSPRSFRRYQYFRSFFRLWAEPLSKLLVQHEDDAQRFAALGVAADKMVITGSIKFDITFPPNVQAGGEALRASWGKRPVWIAASTHKGEDEQVLQACRQVLSSVPDALLMLVPRHPQRFDAVAALCTSEFVTVRRSSGVDVTPDTQVYLGDTMGELPLMLAAADVAFVGGSLVEIGGHNLLEPAALGKPCLSGPHYFNFADITRQLVAQGGAQVVQDAQELAALVSDLLQDEAKRTQMGNAASAVVLANRGALQKTLQELESFLS